MKMNKRELRKFADPGLNFNPGDGLLLYKEIEYIVRAAVKIIAGKRTLAVYFYNREKSAGNCCIPEYTLFHLKDDYIALQRTDDGKLKWRTSCIDNISEKYGSFTKKCAFYKLRDEQIITSFCGMENSTGFDALNKLQTTVMTDRLIIKQKARDRAIIERMRVIPAIPRDFNDWIRNDLLPHYIFYQYKRTKKPIQGYCTACCRDVLIKGQKHNASGKCPGCGKDIIFKAKGVAKKLCDRITVQILQKTAGNEFAARIFKVKHCLNSSCEPVLDIWENARLFIWRDESNIICEQSYFYDYNKGLLTKWREGTRPRFSIYQYNFECDICGYLYVKNLDKILAGTVWQYSQLERFADIDCEPLEVLPYLKGYLRYPAIEYLVKFGLTKLTSHIVYGKNEYGGEEIINTNGKTFRETLGVGLEDLPVLQKVNADINQLELYQALKKQGFRADETLLAWYKEQEISLPENILIPLKYTTPFKIMRYAEEQFEKLKNLVKNYGYRRYFNKSAVLSEYKDYLSMSEKLEYDMTDTFILFPKNLQESHDLASKLYDIKKASIFNGIVQEAYQGLLEQYSYKKDGLTVIPPKTSKEIVKEGQKLHHCVASYVEKVAKSECVILFIRQTEDIQKPFYTMEIRNGKVVQIHGQNHAAPTPEVNKFLEQWKRKKLPPANKTGAA